MTKSAVIAKGFIDLTADTVNYHTDKALIIEDGRIVGFDKASSLAPDVEIVDQSQAFCLPGLVDTAFLPGLITSPDGSRPDSFGESVWQAKTASETWLKTGITSTGSMGGADRIDLDLTASISAGRIPGPRIYPALSPLVPTGAKNFPWLYGVREVSGADDARRAARETIKAGADRLVVYADVPLTFTTDPVETNRHRLYFSSDELNEFVTQAEQAGCYVHAQAISTEAIDNCINANVRSIGCGFGLLPRQIPELANKGIAIAPNLALGTTIQELGQAAGIPAGMIEMVSRQRIAPELLVQAHEAGVELVCGSNAAFLQGHAARECLELHRAGLSAVDALRAVTHIGASCLRPFVECGAFKPFYFADLVFLPDNPVEDLNALAQIGTVMIGGNLVH